MASRRSARLAALVSNAKAAEPAPLPAPAPGSRKRKAATQAPTAGEAEATPSTPRRQRTKEDGSVPATPTPSAAALIAEEAHTRKPKPAAVNRLANPSRTNALLRSPKTSRIIASDPVEAASPSKLREGASTIEPTTTTANILEEACAHLIRVDPRMKPLIEKHHCRIFSPEGLAEQIDPFEALCSSIISQQVSGAAAKSIKARFIALFNNGSEASSNGSNGIGNNNNSSSSSDSKTNSRTTTTDPSTPPPPPPPAAAVASPPAFPRPEQVAATPIERLRTAGLSQRKAEYLRGLADKFATGELTAQMLAEAPYEELLARLTAVRGLGRWTAEMFACFALRRMDVFSLGDLGVQRGMAAFVGRDVARLKSKGGGAGGGKWKYMSEREMEEISDRFRPYRSVFMWYMWRVEETDISTMEK